MDEWEGEVYWGFRVWASGIGRCKCTFFCFTGGRGIEGSGRRKGMDEGRMLIVTVGAEFELDGAGCGQCANVSKQVPKMCWPGGK